MAKLQPMSCSVSELAYSPQKFVQHDIDHSYHVALTPHNSIIQGNNIIFHIEGGADFTDLGNTILEVEIQTQTTADAQVEETDNVCPVNNIFHSMWSQIQVHLKDCVVSHPSANYGYRAYLENLVNFSQQSKDTWMSSVGWHMDEATKFDVAQNSALAERQSWIVDNKVLKLRGKLSTDISNQPLLIPSHTDVTYTLTPQRMAFALQNFENDTDFVIKIVSATLFVRKVKLFPAKQAEFERQIAKEPIHLPISQVKVSTVSIPNGLTSFQHNALFHGNLPSTILLGLVQNASYTGAKTKNPFNFVHANLNFVQLKVNEILVPTYPITPDFEKKKSLKRMKLCIT